MLLVPRFQARVLVRLRPSVLDPAGEAARGAAERLGVEGLSNCGSAKVGMELEAPDEAEACRRLELLSDRPLSNPVIEDRPWSRRSHEHRHRFSRLELGSGRAMGNGGMPGHEHRQLA